MPSPGEDIQSWSPTAANNGNSDPLIDWHEGQTRASVNNSARSEMAAHAKNRNLNNGSIVTTGSPNAQQFLSGLTYTSIPPNLRVTLKVGPGLTNTGTMTLSMDGLAAGSVRTSKGVELLGGEFIAGDYVDLLYDGSFWIFRYAQQFIDDQLHGGGGLIIGKRVYDVAGSYTYSPSAGTECVIIECIGAGGGGGVGGAVGGEFMVGAGGGSGGYSRKIATADDIGASQAVTVGAGGAGGLSGAPATDGGVSSLGTLCVANGGGFGSGASGGILPAGGAGAAAGTGDIAAAGTPGGPGFHNQGAVAYSRAGSGGSSAFGGGGLAPSGFPYPVPGGTAGKYGSGGAGGQSYNGSAPGNGGAGSPGLVFITEFAGRGAPGRDGSPGAQGPIGPQGPAGSGTGDVLRFGTPVVGQIAKWTDAAHIQGVDVNTLFNVPPVCGRLVYVSGTQIKFVPYNGDRLKINGSIYAIPAAGVSSGNTGVVIDIGSGGTVLAANTTYLVSAVGSGGNVTSLAFWTSLSHAPDTAAGNVGTEIPNGVSTHSVVGMIRTNGAGQFQDDANGRFLLSWFNRQRKTASGYLSAIGSTTASVAYVTFTGWRAQFLLWGAEEADFNVNATINNSVGVASMGIGFDSPTNGEIASTYAGGATNIPFPASIAGSKSGLSEGYHYANGLLAASSGSVSGIGGGVPTPPVTSPAPGSNQPASIFVSVSG